MRVKVQSQYQQPKIRMNSAKNLHNFFHLHHTRSNILYKPRKVLNANEISKILSFHFKWSNRSKTMHGGKCLIDYNHYQFNTGSPKICNKILRSIQNFGKINSIVTGTRFQIYLADECWRDKSSNLPKVVNRRREAESIMNELIKVHAVQGSMTFCSQSPRYRLIRLQIETIGGNGSL